MKSTWNSTFLIPLFLFLAIMYWWYGGINNYLEKRKKRGERNLKMINKFINSTIR
jgi:hypothetical protein